MVPQLPSRLHILARHIDGQWVVECLDFCLAAQDDTLEAAETRLQDQIHSFVEAAFEIDGGAHASQLLRRKAPWSDWVLFQFAIALKALKAARGMLSAYEMPYLPQPA